jgi:hypothetical protein
MNKDATKQRVTRVHRKPTPLRCGDEKSPMRNREKHHIWTRDGEYSGY